MSDTTASSPNPVTLHWIMTVCSSDGRQGTRNGSVQAVPGVHTYESTYEVVRKSMEEWLGTENLTVVFFTLNPNQL